MWGTAPIAWVVATGSARDAGGWGSIPDSGVNKGIKNEKFALLSLALGTKVHNVEHVPPKGRKGGYLCPVAFEMRITIQNMVDTVFCFNLQAAIP